MEKLNFNKTRFLKVAAGINDLPPQDRPEIVLSGKSNVGKSSLINALGNNRKLAKVSQTPGKTRQIIYFDVDDRLLIADLPGYGYSGASHEKTAEFSALCDNYFKSGRAFRLVLCLIDIRHEPSVSDIAMIEYLNNANIPYFCVFTKCDKLSRAQTAKQIDMMAHYLDFCEDAHVFAVSAQNQAGISDLRDAIDDAVSK